jgi:hypothetical protein
VAILILFFMPRVMAFAQDTGTIQGTVVNGTGEGYPVEGQEVVLYIRQGQRERDPLVTTTDAQGRFRFPDLQVSDEWAYLARAPYRGVTYSTGPLAFGPAQDELTTDIEVYEPTTDDKNIRVERAHIFVKVNRSGRGHAVQCAVSELHVFGNSGDRTYIGVEQTEERQPTSTFMLPRASANLALDDGDLDGRFLPIEGGFVDTEPHWPGTTRVMYSYTVDHSGEGCDLSRTVLHPTSDLNVLVVDAEARVESTRLTFEGKREAQGQHYLN